MTETTRDREGSAMNRTITAVAAAFAIFVSAYSAEAQQKAPLIGFLTAGTESVLASRYTAFREQMRALGYVEGRTIRYAYRYAEGRRQRLARLAAELVRLKPDVIVTHGERRPASPGMRFLSGVPTALNRNPYREKPFVR